MAFEALAAQVRARGPVRSGAYADLAGERFDLVVNATSASLKGELPPLAPGVFAPDGRPTSWCTARA